MKKWEYEIITVHESENPKKYLDAKGLKGWELVSTHRRFKEEIRFYFKREKQCKIKSISRHR